MGLRFDPVGGGQFKQALEQIKQAERVPIKSLEQRKAREEQRLKLFQEFKTKFAGFEKTLNEFSDFKKFRELKVDLGDGESIVGVTLDKERAEPGVYSIQVDQMAGRGSIISNNFENPDEPVLGSGFITFRTADGESAEIFVDDKFGSIRGVASLINREMNCPVRASVIKDSSDTDKPWKLILTAKDEVADKRVDFPEFYFMDGYEDIYIDDEKDPQNALINMEGFPIESESNQIKEFVTGVNLHLKQARPERPITISITEDYQKIAGKVKGLVDQVNGVLEFINKQNAVDQSSDTRAGFTGDTSLQNIEYRFRNLMHEGYSAGIQKNGERRFVFLNQIGVTFQKNGTLAFSEEKFQKALETDFQGISNAITGEMGMAHQLKAVVANYTRGNDGLLTMREQGLKSRIKRIDDDIANKERRVDQRMQSLTEQFSRLQATLGNMQKQQQYLSATLPGAGGGGNVVQQLLGG